MKLAMKKLGVVALLSSVTLPVWAMDMAERVVVKDPWVGAPPPFSRALGGFMKLENPTEAPAVLVSAQAPEFGMVMLHRSINENGMHRMVHVEEALIPSKGTLVFKHGSYHIMLMQPKRQFKPGDKIPITLGFKDGSKKLVAFPVEKRIH